MTLQQLEYFIEMAKTLHYTQAAEKLFISQSSLSYAVDKLEKELGVSLFETRKNKTTLTAYGESFLPYSKEALYHLEQGVKELEKLSTSEPIVNLGYIYSVSFDFMPKALSGFYKSETGKKTQFHFFQGPSSTICQKLKDGELEIALCVNPKQEFLYAEPIYAQELFLVLPKNHYLAKQDKITLADLHGENFVSISANSSLRELLDGLFVDFGVTPSVSFIAEECNAMASFVSNNFGIAIMPEIPALHSYNVEVRPFMDPIIRQIYVVWNKKRGLSAPALRFKNYLLAYATNQKNK